MKNREKLNNKEFAYMIEGAGVMMSRAINFYTAQSTKSEVSTRKRLAKWIEQAVISDSCVKRPNADELCTLQDLFKWKETPFSFSEWEDMHRLLFQWGGNSYLQSAVREGINAHREDICAKEENNSYLLATTIPYCHICNTQGGHHGTCPVANGSMHLS